MGIKENIARGAMVAGLMVGTVGSEVLIVSQIADPANDRISERNAAAHSLHERRAELLDVSEGIKIAEIQKEIRGLEQEAYTSWVEAGRDYVAETTPMIPVLIALSSALFALDRSRIAEKPENPYRKLGKMASK
ncbi:MAG: hypothetical protein ACM3IJ_00145 [Candidatus Levyibacteriota bacterium]